jgi:hypothetical protein
MAKFAVAVTIAAPGFSRAIGDDQIAHWRQAQGGDARALSFLIDAVWNEGEAQERGISVTDQEASDAVDEQPRDGLTRNDLIYQARVGLLATRIRDQIAQPAAQSVTPEQIDAYVAAHPRSVPERRRARIFATGSRGQAKAIQRSIRRGLSWKSAAKRHGASAAPRTIDRSSVDERLERAIYGAPKNAVTRYGVVVFKVIEIEASRPMPIAQQRATAWEGLSSEAQQNAIDAFKLEFRAKWRQRTACGPLHRTHPDCGNSPTVE